MKISHILSVIAVAAVIAPSAFAQDSASKNVGPTMDYNNEISLAYGNGSIYEFAYLFSGIFTDVFSFGTFNFDNFRTYGSLSVGYQHKVSNALSLGFAAMADGGSYDLLDSSSKNKVDESSFQVFALLPTAKLYWFQRNKFAMYSKAGAGVAYLHDFLHSDEGEPIDSSISFAAQLSPIAFEVGGRCRAFVEYGFGSQGNLMLGVKYGF